MAEGDSVEGGGLIVTVARGKQGEPCVLVAAERIWGGGGLEKWRWDGKLLVGAEGKSGSCLLQRDRSGRRRWRDACSRQATLAAAPPRDGVGMQGSTEQSGRLCGPELRPSHEDGRPQALALRSP